MCTMSTLHVPTSTESEIPWVRPGPRSSRLPAGLAHRRAPLDSSLDFACTDSRLGQLTFPFFGRRPTFLILLRYDDIDKTGGKRKTV